MRINQHIERQRQIILSYIFILTNSHEVCLNFQNENSKIRYKNIYNITIY